MQFGLQHRSRNLTATNYNATPLNPPPPPLNSRWQHLLCKHCFQSTCRSKRGRFIYKCELYCLTQHCQRLFVMASISFLVNVVQGKVIKGPCIYAASLFICESLYQDMGVKLHSVLTLLLYRIIVTLRLIYSKEIPPTPPWILTHRKLHKQGLALQFQIKLIVYAAKSPLP